MHNILATLAVYTQHWMDIFARYFEFGFKPQDVRFSLKPGVGSPRPVLLQLQKPIYDLLKRSLDAEDGQKSNFFQSFPLEKVSDTAVVIEIPNMEELPGTVMYAVERSLRLLEKEKDERIRKTKGEIDHLVRCMLEGTLKVKAGNSFYRKGNYYIPYQIGRAKNKAIGQGVTEAIQDFQKVLDQLKA